MRRAVVDVGSNSLLLLVAEHSGGHWTPILETTEVTALGEETKNTGLLNERALEDTLGALQRAFEVARAAGVEDVFAGVTMAGRIAKNSDELLQRAEAQGTPVKILSGDEEARLGFLAVAEDSMFASERRLSVIDVGGHSTEIVCADRREGEWRDTFRTSFPVGTLGLMSLMEDQETPGPRDLLAATVELDRLISVPEPEGGFGMVVALGATPTNLITLRERMPRWEPERVHGATLEYEEVGRAVGWLCGMTNEQRAELVGMERGRERTLHVGTLILERCLHALRAEECRVSIRGWRHALLTHDFQS
jgi:exopolyphosphatase / guanosine-5'-triphosphate,3'-diphosphate pyrophosphatase